MHIKDPEFDKIIDQIEKFESRLFAHPLHEKEDVDELYNQYLEKDKVLNNFYFIYLNNFKKYFFNRWIENF